MAMRSTHQQLYLNQEWRFKGVIYGLSLHWLAVKFFIVESNHSICTIPSLMAKVLWISGYDRSRCPRAKWSISKGAPSLVIFSISLPQGLQDITPCIHKKQHVSRALKARAVWLNFILYICRIVTDIPGTTDASFGRLFSWFVLSWFHVPFVLWINNHESFRARGHKLREPKT
jgi:hypothetical protein